MNLRHPYRGASSRVLALAALVSTSAQAQTSLPSIDIGREKPVRARTNAHVAPTHKPVRAVAAAAPRRAAVTRSASAAPTVPVPTPAPAPSPISVVAQPPKEDNVTYHPENSFSATKTNAPIMETPASVQVLPRAVLQDTGARTINDTLNLVSGVLSDDPNQAGSTTIIRGFQTFDYYRDGVRMNTNISNTGASLANVDRIEVLKGPASILYGRAEPGGIVNVVTKQPLDTPHSVLEQQVNSWGDFRTTLDTTGPVTQDKSLLYRVNLSSQAARSFQDFSSGQDYFIGPTLRWNIDAATQANLYVDYHHHAGTDYYGAPAYTNARDQYAINGLGILPGAIFGDGPISFLPRNRNYSDPWSRGNNNDIVAGFNWSHDLNEDWNVRHRFQTQITQFWHNSDYTLGLDYFTPTQLDRGAATSYTEAHAYFTSLDLTGKVETLGVGHTLLLGTDFQRQAYVSNVVLSPANNIDMFNPVYTTVPVYSSNPFDPGNTPYRYDSRENWWGVYFQDQMKLPFNFQLLAGGRYDHAMTYDAVAGQTLDNSQRVTPRFGLLWRPIPQVSLYGSYLTNFGASNVGYTKEGNWDLVGNNIPVFFIQDAIKFPDLIHSVKMEADRGYPQAASAHDTFWDFIGLSPETTHMLMWAMSDRTLPRSLRMMEGFGIHTFRLVNEKGDAHFVKFHWRPKLGLQSTCWDEAVKIAGADPDFHRRDLFESIAKGDFPEWEFGVQIFTEAQAAKLPFDVLDATKLIPEEIIPIEIVGRMVLNRNPQNFFAETEQVAFLPSNMPPGVDASEDPLLQGRFFSYQDTQLSRLGGTNFHQIPVNQSKGCPFHNFQRDGHMQTRIPAGRANYEPNSLELAGEPGGPRETPQGFTTYPASVSGEKQRIRSETFADHYSQARLFYRSQSEIEQAHLRAAIVFELSKVTLKHVRERALGNLRNVDEELAKRVAAGLGMTPPAATTPAAPVKDMKPAPSLRLLEKYPQTPKGRAIGVLVTDGADGKIVEAIKAAAVKAGAGVKIVAPNICGVTLKDGARLEADGQLAGTPSVFFDSVALVLSKEGCATLLHDQAATEFVSNAFAHLKTIAHTPEAKPLLEKAGVAPDEGVVDAGDAAGLVRGAANRHYAREPSLREPI